MLASITIINIIITLRAERSARPATKQKDHLYTANILTMTMRISSTAHPHLKEEEEIFNITNQKVEEILLMSLLVRPKLRSSIQPLAHKDNLKRLMKERHLQMK